MGSVAGFLGRTAVVHETFEASDGRIKQKGSLFCAAVTYVEVSSFRV